MTCYLMTGSIDMGFSAINSINMTFFPINSIKYGFFSLDAIRMSSNSIYRLTRLQFL